MIPELCPVDWNHRDKTSLTFPLSLSLSRSELFNRKGRTAEKEKSGKKGARREGGNKSMQGAKGDWRAWDGNFALIVRSVVLYGACAVDGIPPSETGRKSAGC